MNTENHPWKIYVSFSYLEASGKTFSVQCPSTSDFGFHPCGTGWHADKMSQCLRISLNNRHTELQFWFHPWDVFGECELLGLVGFGSRGDSLGRESSPS